MGGEGPRDVVGCPGDGVRSDIAENVLNEGLNEFKVLKL